MKKQERGTEQEYPQAVERALRQNVLINRYGVAVCHALLWVAALSFAAYFHLSALSHSTALLLSTLVAYGAYLFESVLSTVREASGASMLAMDFRRAGLWRWIALNVVVNTTWSLLFLRNPSWVYLVLIILTAGWQKYMDGRTGPRLQATAKPLNTKEEDE